MIQRFFDRNWKYQIILCVNFFFSTRRRLSRRLLTLQCEDMDWKNILLGVIWGIVLIPTIFVLYITNSIRNDPEAMNAVSSSLFLLIPALIIVIIIGFVIATVLTIAVLKSKKADRLIEENQL